MSAFFSVLYTYYFLLFYTEIIIITFIILTIGVKLYQFIF